MIPPQVCIGCLQPVSLHSPCPSPNPASRPSRNAGSRTSDSDARFGLWLGMLTNAPFMNRAVIPMPTVAPRALSFTGASTRAPAATSAAINCQPYQSRHISRCANAGLAASRQARIRPMPHQRIMPATISLGREW
jgi:hypothetical protein